MGFANAMLAIASAVELAEKKKDFRGEPRIEIRNKTHHDETDEEDDRLRIIITRPLISAGGGIALTR